MLILIIGLIMFLGLHSARIFFEQPRQKFIARYGENAWKMLYSIESVVGLGLIIWGYSLARQQPVILWNPPVATKHLAALLTLAAFILVLSSYVKTSFFRSKFHHPMLLGVKLWALSHLLANGSLADALLFGGFLIWAVFCFINSKKRDRQNGIQYPASEIPATFTAIVLGTGAWAAMAFYLHPVLIGVRVFG
jgi:uncharacterized membrane protein